MQDWEAVGNPSGVQDIDQRAGTVYALAMANHTVYSNGNYTGAFRMYAGGTFVSAGGLASHAM